MPYDEISLKVREIVARLFERDAATLSDETLLMQDLPCESIDLLEVSVQLGATFHIFCGRGARLPALPALPAGRRP